MPELKVLNQKITYIKIDNEDYISITDMLKSKDLLGLTGYIHGGCSPIGMKKFFRTTIHKSASDFATIIFSGGKIGFQIELSLADLKKVIPFELADIIK